MISCEEATQLMNTGEYQRLHWRKRALLSLHLLLCADCRQYYRQNKLISAIFGSWKNSCTAQASKPLCPNRKAKIQEQIEFELRKKDE